MAARFPTHGEDGRIELLRVGLKVVDAACKQARVEGNKRSGNLFDERQANRVEEHELGYTKLESLLGRFASGATEGSAAVSSCGETKCNGGEMGDLTGLDVGEQYVLPDVSGDICESDVVHGPYAAILRKEATTGDESSDTVKEGEGLSGGGGFVQNV